MSNRKRYTPLPDARLDALLAQAENYAGTMAHFGVEAITLYNMVKEIIDLREEVFRLGLCETVDQILARELDRADEDVPHAPIPWMDGKFMFDSKHVNGKHLDETSELPRLPDLPPPIFPSTYEGRRLPPFDE